MPEDEPSDLGGRRPLPVAFFERDPETVARELLGALLVTEIGGVRTGGTIVETEAYLGADDPGSHAATKRITDRNRVMYGPPAHAYVYFTYGNHHMLNLVTCAEGTAGAVLVRAIEPLIGLDAMELRRHGRSGRELANGPGKVAEALGVTLEHNAAALQGEIAVYEGRRPTADEIATSGRVGLSAGHDLPLRFYLVRNEHVSRGRTGPRLPKRRQ